MLFVLSIASKPFKLNVIMLNVILLIVVAPQKNWLELLAKTGKILSNKQKQKKHIVNIFFFGGENLSKQGGIHFSMTFHLQTFCLQKLDFVVKTSEIRKFTPMTFSLQTPHLQMSLSEAFHVQAFDLHTFHLQAFDI